MRELLSFLSPLAPLALAVLLFAAPASALEVGRGLDGAAPVAIEADELIYDKATATYRAQGQVRLRKGELTLLSDHVEWNTETGDAAAVGNVRLSEPGGEMEGESLTLNLDSGVGRLSGGRVLLREENFHIAGSEIEKLGEQSYRVTGGSFTTCDGEAPAWRFGAKRLDVTLGGYARAKGAVFYLRDLPLVYVPYLIYPAKTERESGFLMPRYGYSQKRGTELSLVYYQVIDRHLDATFYLDYLSDLGVGKGLEYRYIFGEENEGVAKAYHVNGLNGAHNRYAFDWQHQGNFPGGARLAADVEYVSSRDYFDDFGEIAEEYNKDNAQSVFTVSRNWRKLNLSGQLKYLKDLEADNDATLQRLPELRLSASRQRLGDSPFYAGFDSAYTYFWRREGLKGQRLTARPFLAAAFSPGRLLEIQPEIGYRERLYQTSDDGPGFEREGIYDFTTRVSTRLSRVFSPERRLLKKIRHSIEPEMRYRYVPPENQDHLPQFDSLDDIGPQNRVTFSLTNRFTARLEPEEGEAVYHEFLYLRLSQDYDIRESRRDRLNAQDKLRPFSDVRAELIVRPTRWSFLDLDARYDVDARGGFRDRFLVFNLRGGAHDGSGNRISLDYRYRQEDLEYFSGNLDLAVLKPVYLHYQHRYDFEDSTTLEQVVNLEYRAQCWSVFFTVRDRLEDTEYLVTFALSGIGKVAGFGGSLGAGDE